MTRSIPTSLLNALFEGGNQSNALTDIQPFYGVDLDFDSGNLRLWTGFGAKTISGQSYTGSGNLLSIGGLAEVSDLSAKGVNLTLSGIPTALVSYALTEEYQGRAVAIYWGIEGVSDVVEVFSGYMDTMTISDSGESSTIGLTVESRLITLERAIPRRYTEESHQAVRTAKGLTGADTFFSYVTDLQDKQIVWGREVSNG